MLKQVFSFGFTAFLIIIGLTLNAQPVGYDFTEGNGGEIIIQSDDDLTTAVFFTDPEYKLLFIDFEELDEEISKLVIKDGSEVIVEDNVEGLPSNTIYEIDMTKFRKGTTYTLYLTTPFGIIKKEFTIKQAS